MTQVLLLNLLIAMMTDTYAVVMRFALIEWKYEHMLLVDYYRRSASPTPPPFNVFLRPLHYLLLIMNEGFVCAMLGEDDGADAIDDEGVLAVDTGTEHRDESRAFNSYMHTRAAKRKQEVRAGVDDVHSVVKALELKQMEDREAQDHAMQKLRRDIEWLKQQVADVPRANQREGYGGRVGRRRAAIHTKARSEGNKAYDGKRALVPDWRVPWEVSWPAYEPNEWTHPVVLGDPDQGKPPPEWADVPDAADVDFSKRKSLEQPIVCTPIGRPLNPRGRTGISGRGLLGKWGPNHAADPIVLRRKPPAEGQHSDNLPDPDAKSPSLGGVFQMVAILRSDVGKWAIPGGMVDEGELVTETLRREFSEEAGSHEDPLVKEALEDQLDEIFKDGGRKIYEGYVDDPRNTDNAWLETTACLFFVDAAAATKLQLQGGSDALHAQWLDVDDELLDPRNDSLYADHRHFIRLAFDQEKNFLLGAR